MNGAATGSFVERLRGMSDARKVLAVRGGAEVVSIAAATAGAVLVGDVLLRKPYKSVKEWVGAEVVLPHLAGFEHWLERFPSIDTPSERLERHQLPPEQRAQIIGEKMMDIFGLPMVMGWAGQFIAQSYGIKALGLTNITKAENRLAFVGDKVAMAGAILALNTGLSEQSESWQQGLCNGLKRMGMSDETAKSMSAMLVNWQVPNLAGFVASVGILNWARK